MDERRERLHVVALEGVDVAGEQLGVRLVLHGRLGVRAEVPRLERGPRALQRAVDGGDARLEQLGDLGRLPAQDLAEDQHRALLRRQVLEGRDEREPDRLPRNRHLGRVALRRDTGVGHRLHPLGLGSQVEVGYDRLLGRPEVHRHRTALASLDHVEADVRRDAVEPGAQRGTPLEAVDAPPRANERLLDGVLGVERRAEHPVAVAGQLSAVLLEALGDCRCRLLHQAHTTDRAGAGGGTRLGDPRARRRPRAQALQGRRQARTGGGDHGARPRARLSRAAGAGGARRLSRARARRRADDAGGASPAARGSWPVTRGRSPSCTDRLHEIPFEGERLLHLDFHPDNVLLSQRGPVVIDWANARAGDPALDVAMTWVICATSGGALGRVFTRFFLRHVDLVAARAALPAAAELRIADPNVTDDERERVRSLVRRMS